MHLVLFGATGLVGSSALAAMIKRSDITKVTCISRKPVPMAEGHAKVDVHLHDDYLTYDDTLMSKIKDARGCVWALGISQSQVSKSEYVKITRDYTLAAAQAFSKSAQEADAGFNFVFVSGEGATHAPGMLTPIFGRCKGETELELLQLAQASPSAGRFRAYNVRPGAVDSREQAVTEPHMPKMAVLKTPLLGLIKTLYSGMHSPTTPLGEFLVKLAAGDGLPLKGEGVENGGWLITNKGFRGQMGIS